MSHSLTLTRFVSSSSAFAWYTKWQRSVCRVTCISYSCAKSYICKCEKIQFVIQNSATASNDNTERERESVWSIFILCKLLWESTIKLQTSIIVFVKSLQSQIVFIVSLIQLFILNSNSPIPRTSQRNRANTEKCRRILNRMSHLFEFGQRGVVVEMDLDLVFVRCQNTWDARMCQANQRVGAKDAKPKMWF